MVLIREIVEPQQGLVYKSDQIKLKIGHNTIGTGTLYISEENLAWKPENRTDGISLLWKQISLHGISNNPTKSVYFIIEEQVVWDGVFGHANGNGAAGGGGGGDVMLEHNNQDDSDNDEGHESDCEEMTELWLIPLDPTATDPIFQAMKECQSLHPDSADSISEESDFMDAIEDHGDFDGMNEDGVDGNMRNLNIDDRFEDEAEE